MGNSSERTATSLRSCVRFSPLRRKSADMSQANRGISHSFLITSQQQDKILKQLSDPRSSLIEEACTTVSTLSIQLGSRFTFLAEQAIPKLLPRTCETILAINAPTRTCISTLLKNSPACTEFLATTGVSHKHEIARQNCVLFCLQLLQEQPTTFFLEKHADQLEALIIFAVRDKEPTTRQHARACYWSFNSHWPNRIGTINGKIDQKTLQLIQKEKSAPKPVTPQQKSFLIQQFSNRENTKQPIVKTTEPKPITPATRQIQPVKRFPESMLYVF